jgi:hypothetical protein
MIVPSNDLRVRPRVIGTSLLRTLIVLDLAGSHREITLAEILGNIWIK